MTPALLIESALRASALGAGVWVLLWVLRMRSSARAWMIWLAVLTTALLMPLIASTAVRWLPHTILGATAPSVVEGFAAVTGQLIPSNVGARDTFRDIAALLWSTYLGVATLLIGRLGVGVLRARWLWHHATPVPALSRDGVQVRSSDRVDTPVVVASGILLPREWNTWSDHTRQCVLIHERSHVVRRDFHWQLLARLHAAVFWASPFAWWLSRTISVLAEHLSDDAVLAVHGNAADYADVLLRFAGGRRTALPTVGMARRSALSERIERVLRERPGGAGSRHSNGLMVVCTVAVAVASVVNPWLRIDVASAATHSVVSPGGLAEGQHVASSPRAMLSPRPAMRPMRSQPLALPRLGGLNKERSRRLQPVNEARLGSLAARGESGLGVLDPAGTVSTRLKRLEVLGTLADGRASPR
ncbi:MAG: M56 family metallopeptidase [Gemmatimonadaceae bacterium]|jgi:beta-lactamase regulating signal transducer with metallopeptidase domain|nr:M56 family metallopeptidase [Gemmatimonadaceae bacterium]